MGHFPLLTVVLTVLFAALTTGFIASDRLLLSRGTSSRTLDAISAKRQHHETFTQALKKHQAFVEGTQSEYPVSVKVPLEKLDISEIPELDSMTDLEIKFNYSRDTRFIAPTGSELPRRLTWLFPDDGCFARSEMAAREIIDTSFPAPKKFFAFGDLSVVTENSPYGIVHWWYHVVPIYRIGKTPYILDPAINPERLMTLTEWNQAIGGEATLVEFSICSHETFGPFDDCYSPDRLTDEEAVEQQRYYLGSEWNRLLELERIPERELGDYPPWL